jgi:tetratricopeptide (TPR) repeat protein
MRILLRTVCLFTVAGFLSLLCADDYEQEVLDLARLGSATYNISFQFFEDELWELTQSEREQKITEMKGTFEKGKLSPLKSIDLIRLLGIERREKEEEAVINTLVVRLDSILEENPKDGEALLSFVKLQIREGDNSLLILLLADTTLETETYVALLLELVNVHFRYGNYAQSEEVINYILSIDSLNSVALVTRTLVHSMSALSALLEGELGVFSVEIENVPPEKRLEKIVPRLQKTFDLIDFSSLLQLLKQDPENFKYNFLIGGMKEFIVYLHYIMLIGEYNGELVHPQLSEDELPILKEIKTYLDKSLEVKPQGDIDSYMAMAMYYVILSQFDKAKEYAQKAVDTRPEIDQPYDAMITIINYEKQIFEENVEESYRLSIEILEEKRMKKSLTFLDRLLYVIPYTFDEEYETVLSELKIIENDFPDEKGRIFLFRGAVFLRTGKVDEGIEVLMLAMKAEPDNIDVMYNLGLGNYLKKEYDIALMYLNQALKLDPDDKEITELIEKVEEAQ